MKTNKQLLAGALSALLAFSTALPQGAFAAASGTIDLTVTATCGTRAITITNDPTPYNFGSVALNITTHSTRAVSVANPGSATCADTWSLQVTANGGAPAWTAGSAKGTDTYELRAVFAVVQPVSGGFTDTTDTVLQTASTACGGSNFVDGTGDCTDIAAGGGAQSLWFQLDLPSTSSGSADPGLHTITVTVSTL